MNLRVLEVLAAVVCFVIFVLLLVVLPDLMVGMEGFAYVAALAVFISSLGIAGYLIDRMVM